MSDSELWKKLKKSRQEKRWRNYDRSIKILKDKGIDFEIKDVVSAHLIVEGWSFWPTTGKFYNPKTKEKGRGVFNLIKQLK